MIPLVDIFACFFGTSFITSMLQEHLESIGVDIEQVANVFLARGVCFLAGAFIVGIVSKN